MFNPILPSREATQGPLSLRQEDRTVSARMIEFNLSNTGRRFLSQTLVILLRTTQPTPNKLLNTICCLAVFGSLVQSVTQSTPQISGNVHFYFLAWWTVSLPVMLKSRSVMLICFSIMKPRGEIN